MCKGTDSICSTVAIVVRSHPLPPHGNWIMSSVSLDTTQIIMRSWSIQGTNPTFFWRVWDRATLAGILAKCDSGVYQCCSCNAVYGTQCENVCTAPTRLCDKGELKVSGHTLATGCRLISHSITHFSCLLSICSWKKSISHLYQIRIPVWRFTTSYFSSSKIVYARS
jgi:hypothetical protein